MNGYTNPPQNPYSSGPQSTQPMPNANYSQPQQPPYSQPPQNASYPQTPNPQPEDTGGFGLSLAGLITGVLGICLIGVILSAVGLSKSNKTRKYTRTNSKANASFVMGIIGVIWSGLGLLGQLILVITLLTAGAAAVPFIGAELTGCSSPSCSTGGRTLKDGSFTGENANAVADDLKQSLINDLEASKLKTGSLDVKSMRVDSNRKTRDRDGRRTQTVTGRTVLGYEGQTREVGFTTNYVEVNNNWYLYSYDLDNYTIFPATFTPNIAITQGIYNVANIPAGDPADWGDAPQGTDTGTPTTGDGTPPADDGWVDEPATPIDSTPVSGTYYCFTSLPDTAPYNGADITTSDTALSAQVYGDNTMDLSYNFTGSGADGYINIDLPVQVFAYIEASDGAYYAYGISECEGTYANSIGGGMTVPCLVEVSFEGYIYEDGTMEGVVYQTLIDFEDPSGMYDPSGVFDASFSFIAYAS